MTVYNFNQKLIHDYLGVDYATQGVFNVDHVMWPVAFFLVRVSYEGNLYGRDSAGGISVKTNRIVELCELMDWFAENSCS